MVAVHICVSLPMVEKALCVNVLSISFWPLITRRALLTVQSASIDVTGLMINVLI